MEKCFCHVKTLDADGNEIIVAVKDATARNDIAALKEKVDGMPETVPPDITQISKTAENAIKLTFDNGKVIVSGSKMIPPKLTSFYEDYGVMYAKFDDGSKVYFGHTANIWQDETSVLFSTGMTSYEYPLGDQGAYEISGYLKATKNNGETVVVTFGPIIVCCSENTPDGVEYACPINYPLTEIATTVTDIVIKAKRWSWEIFCPFDLDTEYTSCDGMVYYKNIGSVY